MLKIISDIPSALFVTLVIGVKLSALHYGIQYLVKYDLMLHIWANTDHLCILYI